MKPTADYFEAEDRRLRCLPRIETGTALAEVEKIAALDGLFPCPTDLALTKGQGFYTFDETSRADILRGAAWVLPAWTPAERIFAREHGADEVVIVPQYAATRNGIQGALKNLAEEGFTL